jgi:glycosyltransferase involved in cell wall biosynthesis
VDLNNKENSMIWSSSLARGFEDFYEYVFFPVFQKVPDFKLYVCTGTIAPKDYYLLKKAELLPGVEVLGKLSKEDLASYQKRSKVWVYPGQFPETFCITAVENANAGNVIISPLSYGLSTTLNDIQYLKDLNLGILNKENAQEYVDLTIKVLTDDEERLKLVNECINGCKTYSWDRATQEIIDLLESPQPTETDIYKYVISQINAK